MSNPHSNWKTHTWEPHKTLPGFDFMVLKVKCSKCGRVEETLAYETELPPPRCWDYK